MPAEDESDPHHPVPKEAYADTPPEAFHRSYNNPPDREPLTDIDGRPDLIPRRFAGPDSPIDSDTAKAQQALRYFEFVLVADSDFFENWEELSDREQRFIRVVVLQELFNDTYEELEERLESSSVVAREVGFDPDDTPSHSTLWRRISTLYDDGVIEDDEVIEEIVQRAEIALMHPIMPGGNPLHQVGVSPRKPDFYHEITTEEREIDIDEKMDAITSLAGEYVARAVPHIDFDRDSDAPNYQYRPEAFYRLLAHMALEDCYAEKGSVLLDWQTDHDVAVPSASTLYRYADEYTVDEHAERFLDATCELLNRKKLLPDEPVHLGFDITKIPWYGKMDTDEEGSPTSDEWRIKSLLKDNTVCFWAVGVLSIVAPDRNYVLGFSPVESQKEFADALDTMLNRVEDRFDIEFGRVYLDGQLGKVKILDVCEDHDLNWLVKDDLDSKRKEIVDVAPEDTPGCCKDVEFGSDGTREVNVFACPDPKETVKARGTEVKQEDTEETTLNEFGFGIDPEDAKDEETGKGDDSNTDENEAAEEVESGEIKIRHDLTMEGSGSWSAWDTNMDVHVRDLRGLAYNYRYRWRVETAIRQLKHDFTGRCGVDSAKRRALFLGAGQLFFNMWVILNHELPELLDEEDIVATGLEMLHGIREADFEAASDEPWI